MAGYAYHSIHYHTLTRIHDHPALLDCRIIAGGDDMPYDVDTAQIWMLPGPETFDGKTVYGVATDRHKATGQN